MAKGNFIEAEGLVKKLNEAFTDHVKVVQMSVETVKSLNDAYKKLPSDYAKGLKSYSDGQVKAELAVNRLKKATADLEIKQQRLNQAQTQTAIKSNQLEKSTISLTKAKEQLNKQAEREEAKAVILSNVYNKTQRQLNLVTAEYNNLSAKKERYNNLTTFEENRLKTLTAVTTKYQTTLKGIDTAIGKYTRNVGNYASGFSPLGNAIGQISRELPNFAISARIGIMSLTNNIGALQDAIGGIRAQNKILQAEGKQTQSVMRQIGQQILSFNTALYVGVALFTAYGDEITKWVASLWGASDAMKELAKNNEVLKNSMVDGRKATVADKEALRSWLLTARDTNLSMDERNIALEKIRGSYNGYFKALTDAEILEGKVNSVFEKTVTAIEKRNRVNLINTVLNENQAKIIGLQNDLKILKATENYLIYNRKKGAIIKDINILINQNNQWEAERIKLIKESILLDYKDNNEKTKGNKTKRERLGLLFDSVEAEYNLKLAILERKKAEANDRATNELSFFEDRLKARQDYSDKSIEILELQAQKEKALLTLTYNEDVEKNNLALRNKDIDYQRWTYNITELNKRLSYDLQKIDLDYSLKWNDLKNEDWKFFKTIEDKKRDYVQQTENFVIQSEKNRQQRLSQDERKTLKTRQEAFESYVELAEQELTIQLARDRVNAKSAEELDLINEKYADAIRLLGEIETPLQKAQEATAKWLNEFRNDSISEGLETIGLKSLEMFTLLDVNGQSTFTKLIEGAKNSGEEFAIAFNAMGEVAKDVFSIIQEGESRRFEQAISNLEKQKNTALLFAGESATARAEIERQYEEKRAHLERKRAIQQKQTAIFNAVIGTAQGIVTTIAQSGFPAAIPLIALVAAIGAAQIAMISSQQIPEFYKGTDNAPEGLAWTQERGAELITDKHGKIKSVGSDKGAKLTYLNKGDKVFDAKKTKEIMFNNELNGILMNNGISNASTIVNNNVDLSPLRSDIQALERTIKNKPEWSLIRDVQGERLYQKEQGVKKLLVSNRLRIKG